MKCTFLIAFLFCSGMQACKSQPGKNPEYLGIGHGNFDIDLVSFKENLDTLFSKSVQSYKRTERESDTGNVIGYQYFLSIKRNQGLKVYFMNEEFNEIRCQFITDKNNVFGAVKLSMQRATTIDILSQINKKYGKYAVKLKKKNAFHNYQWDTPEKYISLAVSDKLGDDGYMYYLVIAGKTAVDNKFPIDFFSKPVIICLDKSCKE